MRTTTTCSWCHHLNDAGQRSCDNCGHDSDRARTDCRCSACAVTVSMANGSTITLRATDSVSYRAATERLRGRAEHARALRAAGITKLDHVAAGRMLQYIIYHNLRNWPDQYVVRVFRISDTLPMMPSVMPLLVTDDLAAARTVVPRGYINAGRSADDPSCFLEVWV